MALSMACEWCVCLCVGMCAPLSIFCALARQASDGGGGGRRGSARPTGVRVHPWTMICALTLRVHQTTHSRRVTAISMLNVARCADNAREVVSVLPFV
jgi:hypothetical protein